LFDGKYLEWNQKRIKCIIDFYGHQFMYMKKLLDLGCGQADISGAMYRLGADVTAVDARQEHLTTATKKFQGIKVVKADLERGWPFANQKYDVILDLGLLCHIRDYEAHLAAACSCSPILILETAVCDSDDPNKCVTVDESKAIYDNSINGVGCRPSSAAIEKVLTKCGMSFTRVDSNKLNASPFIYDWQIQNTGDTSINRRRIWFCNKVGNSVVPQSSLVKPSPLVTSQNIPFQTRPAIMARPPYTPSSPTQPPVNYSTTMTSNPTSDEVKTLSRKFAISPDNSLNRYPNLKVLYVPLDNQVGMINAWNNIGVQLRVFDFWTAWNSNGHRNHEVNQQFLHHVRDFKPDFIHMQLQITDIITPETIMEAKKIVPDVIISNWSGDIRANVIHQLNVMSRAINYTFISSTGQLDLYKKVGVQNIKYWQIGYDPKVHYPKNYATFSYDVSFIGNNYGNTFPDGNLRMSAVQRCQQVFGNRFGIFGGGWGNSHPCDPKDACEIYNKSICTLSISNFNNVSHYFSDRLLYCLASGRPTISWYFPGIESYFTDGEEIFYAKNVQDIVDKVNFCKQNPDKANEVGMRGAQKVLAEHTYTSRAQELLYLVGLS